MSYPSNLKYSEDHEWIRVEADDIAYIGITDHAQNELGEIVYVEVETVEDTLSKSEEFGTVEAVKATSELYMPVSGQVLEFNPELNAEEGDSPELINEDPYGKGWIIKIKMTTPEELEELMNANDYKAMVGS